MDLSIAGRRLWLLCGEEGLPAPWIESFSEFIAHDGLAPGIASTRLDIHPSAGWPDEVEGCGVFATAGADGSISSVAVEIPDSSGAFERSEGGYRGRFEIDSEGVFGISATLQIALALLVEDAGGLLLHASGVLRDGFVWLFCGPSGAGKTTIATELAERGALFSADRVVVELDGSGRLVAASTPFGDKPGERSVPMTAPVAGIAFISQAVRPRISPATPFEVAKKLFRESRWYSSDTAAAQRTLDNIDRIVQTGLCCHMEFSKDTGFWAHLDAWRAARSGGGTAAR